MYKLCMNCGKILNENATSCIKCSETEKIENINTTINLNEYTKIRYISTDPKFIKEMILLYENDIVEYTNKINQLKINKDKQKNIPKCPTCSSTNLSPISNLSKAGSVALFGIFSQKVKHQWKCNSCGYEW